MAALNIGHTTLGKGKQTSLFRSCGAIGGVCTHGAAGYAWCVRQIRGPFLTKISQPVTMGEWVAKPNMDMRQMGQLPYQSSESLTCKPLSHIP